jgi:hypothetical protein
MGANAIIKAMSAHLGECFERNGLVVKLTWINNKHNWLFKVNP